MTEIKQNCLVIGEKDLKDNDKLLTVLSEKYGKIFVIGKGVKSLRNRHMASCQLFSYSSFSLRKRGNYYYITDSDLIENYYEIRTDLEKLSLATFVCDVVSFVTVEHKEDRDILKLTLNTLFAIAKNIKDLEIIRSAFSMRLCYESGLMPDLSSCGLCGKADIENTVFDIMNGRIYCKECSGKVIDTEIDYNKPIALMDKTVLTALRYVISAKPEKFLSFIIDKTEIPMLANVCEKYLLNQLETDFNSLEFYKQIKIV